MLTKRAIKDAKPQRLLLHAQAGQSSSVSGSFESSMMRLSSFNTNSPRGHADGTPVLLALLSEYDVYQYTGMYHKLLEKNSTAVRYVQARPEIYFQ